ncbi:rod-binding protein [Azospirillum rugosum]|uniref:Rod binding domain-containing protein n=1 Tax=Azospirillum rugosum TaxID=416170 RepID=A0ABS4SUC9_9PROT|nr:rod-binding protein [Azospirillum rugosum]MBP2296037.1 Rod binding domain-containing protein [Azospirillum rugosum]MDQ0529627.1 Rod binding domain-containing protein [Azospirillum rugosum]
MDVTALPSPAPAPVRAATAAKAPDPAQHAAKDFEAMMVGQMLESMFAGVDAGNAFGGGQGERTWRSFMLQEYGKAIAEAGTLGIGRMVQADVARLYAQQNEDAGA